MIIVLSLVCFVPDGTVKTKSAILLFLYCGEFVKDPIRSTLQMFCTGHVTLSTFGEWDVFSPYIAEIFSLNVSLCQT